MESCYKCGRPLDEFCRQLCPQCRAKAEITEATGENPDDEPKPWERPKPPLFGGRDC